MWDKAEQALESVVKKLGWEYSVQPGAGAFYGPKLEFVLKDKVGRKWQCGTIQYDLAMPRSFDLRFVDAGGERRHVVMLHRALYGSLERFLGIVLEEHGKNLPYWMAPEQVVVLPISSEHRQWAEHFRRDLAQAGLRAEIDAGNETLSKRVAEARNRAVPFLAIVGRRELEERSVTIRAQDGQATMLADKALDELRRRCACPSFEQ